ncbi:MAG: sulfatase [Bacteroidales bacterium]|nr:sulfatase [Bacteroidales bacterium]
MKISQYFFTSLALLGASLQTADRTSNLQIKKLPNAKPRNVVFILSDDHRYNYMGFLGTIPWLQTPGMDRMAKEGAYLKNAFVTTSLSSPSRASILTGLYSHQHKVIDNSAPLPENLIFFPQYLQKMGYQTAFFGKWHIGYATGDPAPGFNHWEGMRNQGEYWAPNVNINGKWTKYSDTTYVTDLLTEHAISFIKKQNAAKKPFFVYLSHKGVHGAFSPAKRHIGCYKDKEVPIPASFNSSKEPIKVPPTYNPQTKNLAAGKDFYGKNLAGGKDFYGENMIPNWTKNQRESWHGVEKSISDIWIRDMRKYCETLRSVDESIISILNCLKELRLDSSTLVIYMSDNGYAWGEHGLLDKRQFYEESVRVPLLARCPELFKGGTEVEQMVQNVDIAPTILEAAGLGTPKQMVGKSFISLLQGKEILWRNRIFYEYFWEYDFPQTPTTFGVRTDRYKFIRYYGIWDTNEFFDLKEDPFETKNLIGEKEYQPLIKQLNNDLDDWLESSGGMSIPLKRVIKPHSDHRNYLNY